MNKELIQGTDEWLSFRKNHIGASDSPVIMGVCRFKTKNGRTKTSNMLWKEKLSLIEINCNTYATEYGNKMEDYSREVYEGMVGDYFKPKVFIHKEVPYLMASLDGINENETRAVEIKNTNKEFHEMARNGKIPDCYYPQLQHQLACVGMDEMDYFSFNNHEGIIVKVKRDEEYLKELYKKTEEFWDCVMNLTEPKLTSLDYIPRDTNWEKCATDLWNLKEEKKTILSKEKELETLLKKLSNDENSCCKNFRYTRSITKGSIDYNSIPDLQNVNIENYRKPSTIRWGIRKER